MHMHEHTNTAQHAHLPPPRSLSLKLSSSPFLSALTVGPETHVQCVAAISEVVSYVHNAILLQWNCLLWSL